MVGHRGIACVWVVLSLLVGPGVVFIAPATAKKAKHAADLARVPGKGPDLLVSFQTSHGTIRCRLNHQRAPRTVGNFVGLATGTRDFKDLKTGKMTRRPFYDGLTFHRVIPNFMIQTGCPKVMARARQVMSFQTSSALVFDTTAQGPSAWQTGGQEPVEVSSSLQNGQQRGWMTNIQSLGIARTSRSSKRSHEYPSFHQIGRERRSKY